MSRLLPLVLLALPVTLQADYQDGLNAYGSGDYDRALAEWQAVTESPPGEVNPAIYAEAHYAVAKLYWLGQGVPLDHRQAHEWLLKAAELDHAGAQAKLGFLYTDGKVVNQDFNQAYDWYSKSAQQGNVDGLYNLGIFHLYGWGTEQDTTMAAQYLAAAATLGDEAAEEALQTLLPMVGETVQAPEQVVMVQEAPFTEEAAMAVETPVRLLMPAQWILQQEPEHYTIQVIALSTRARVEALIEGQQALAPFALYSLENQGNPLFVLVQGSYPDVESARRVRESFPAEIQSTENLWIRRFAMVQALIEENGNVEAD